MEDKIITCTRCGSDSAYVQGVNEKIKITQCFGCGFTTSTLLKPGEVFFEEQMLNLPNLYKELMGEDKEGNIWMPAFIDHENGMIFANGPNGEQWNWAAVKKVIIPEDERSKYPIPGKSGEFYTMKTDTNTLKEFDEKDFIEALDYLGLLIFEE